VIGMKVEIANGLKGRVCGELVIKKESEDEL
jgi:hypothetical protein